LLLGHNHVLVIKEDMADADSLVVYLHFAFLHLYNITICFGITHEYLDFNASKEMKFGLSSV
jgi:hypothetical protein